MADRLQPTERHQFLSPQGQLVYEWDQTLSEVNIYIQVPEGTRARNLAVEIKPRHLSVGIKGNPPYLDKDLGGLARTSDSLWTLDGTQLCIQLAKAEEAATWASALAGHELDPARQQADQKRLMLERFQEENPGFDFSGAQFNGDVPDPRTFMRGLGDN